MSMRYRHANEHQSLKKHVNSLINKDDVLSTAEQEEIIGYFSDSLRCTLQFTQVVACLNLLIAAVYVGLLLSGSPLVFKVLSQKEKRDLESIWQQRSGQGVAEAAAGRAGVGSPQTAASDSDAVLAGLHNLYQQQRHEQQEQVMSFMTYRTALDTSPSLTPLNTVVMLFSALLLAVGGIACWRACRAMRVDKEELINMQSRELGAGPLGPSSARAPGSASGPSRRQARRSRSISEAVIAPLWRSHAGIQLFLVVCSLAPTLYWVRTLSRSHRQLNELYRLLNLPTSKLFLGVTDDILELALVIWQPFFHLGIFFMLRSLQDTREKLFGLARTKYQFDKL